MDTATKEPKHVATLRKLGACDEAIKYAATFSTAQAAWDECDDQQWMLWLVGNLSGEPGSKARRKLVGCLADIAEQSLPLFENKYPSDDRPRKAIEACRAYSRGEINHEQCREAANAAANAAAYAANAANAAAYAANAAAYAANAAAYAANAANAAAYAANAANAAAYAASLKKSADIVRNHYPKVPRSKRRT